MIKRKNSVFLIVLPIVVLLILAFLYFQYSYVPFPDLLAHFEAINPGKPASRDNLVLINYEPPSSHECIIKITPDSVLAEKIIAALDETNGQPKILRIEMARYANRDLGASYYDNLIKLELFKIPRGRWKDIFRGDTRITVETHLRKKKNIFQFQSTKNDDPPYDKITEYVDTILKKAGFTETNMDSL